MGGCRCSYKNCQNTTKTTDNIHFFHYPVKHKERCKTWIQRAGKPQFFDLDEFQLRNKVICEIHFEDDCFLNSQKKRLLTTAIPSIDGDSNYDLEPSAPLIVQKPKSKDKFKQFSTKLDDIQILPANDEGTLFVLDTFPSYQVPKGVQSFILNNDALLPLAGNDMLSDKVKTEEMDEDIDVKSNNELMLNDNEQLTKLKKGTTSRREPIVVNFNYEQPMKKSNSESGCHSSLTNSISQDENIPDETLQNIICKTVESKYLHKLEQHTKDLNQIKKALGMSRGSAKLNKRAVLRFLKLRLPQSLYTLVNLALDDDYELTEEDESFFKNLHDTSSKAYDFLMEDCKWRMPIIEIHEREPDSMDDT